MHITYDQVVLIAYECGTCYQEVKRYAVKLGMWVAPQGWREL